VRKLIAAMGLAAAVSAAPAQVSIDWREGTPMPLGTRRAVSGLIDGRIYLFGGLQVPNVVHWAYDIAADSWMTELAPMPNPSSNTRGVVYNGELYVLGGYWPSNAALRKYNPADDSWSVLSPPPCRTIACANGAAVVGDRIYYYYGSWNDQDVSNEFWEYCPATDSWCELAPAPGAARCFTASASDGDCCYSVGGGTAGGIRQWCLRYDVSADSWETLPDYPVAAFYPDGDFLRGRLFIAGGGCSFSGLPERSEVYCWTEAGGWDSTDFLPEPVGNPQVELTTLNDTDYIFVMGGTRGRMILNSMYVGVITGLESAGAGGPAEPARDRVQLPTIVRGVLSLPRDMTELPGNSDRVPRPYRAALLDADGRKVRDLVPGENDVSRLSPGVYFCRQTAGFASSGPASGVERPALSVAKVVVTR